MFVDNDLFRGSMLPLRNFQQGVKQHIDRIFWPSMGVIMGK
jgi:hypothetical protein